MGALWGSLVCLVGWPAGWAAAWLAGWPVTWFADWFASWLHRLNGFFSVGCFLRKPGCLTALPSGLGSRRRENQSKEARFDDFLALASEFDKTSPRRFDFTFSGRGSGSRQNNGFHYFSLIQKIGHGRC